MTYDTTTEEGQDKRQIKFRVWDKENNKMVDPETYRLEFYGNGEVFLIDVVRTTSDIEIMQYTGLKDKNGKEIYEGDIVECEQLGQKQKGKVIFRKGMWSWEFEKGKDSWLYECVKQWKGEIIGNIYENPELLGNTK